MTVRGTPIAGWWAWFPWGTDSHARCFKTKEDAVAWIPVVKTKTTTGPPLGPKHMMRVTPGDPRNDPGKLFWKQDEPIVFSEDEVMEQYHKQEEQTA